ncbi:hypothetical protein OROHE_008084 [Orobanche hederae]
MDEKGKYLLSLGSGGLLGSAATLATSKLLLRVEGNVLNVDFIDSNGMLILCANLSDPANAGHTGLNGK